MLIIAGNSQDGIQAIGGFLARLAGRSEQEVMTFMTIPSTISGGPSIFQVRIGSGEVLSAGDEADVLLAFYQHSYEEHIGSLKKGGIVLYDSDHVEPEAGVADAVSSRRHSDFEPDDRGDRRHGQGQGQEHLRAGPGGPDVRPECAEAGSADQRAVRRQGCERAEQRAGRLPGRLQPLAGQRAGDLPVRREPGQGRPPGGDERQRGHGLRADRRRRALRRRLSHHALVGRDGNPAPRAAEIRRHVRAMRRRDRGHLDGQRRELRRPRGGHRLQRAGHFAEDGSARLGGDGGSAAGGDQRPARRPLHRPADPGRAIGPEPRLFRQPRRCAARRARAGQRRGLLLHRHRGGEHRPQIQRAGLHPQRPGHRHAHRGLSRAGPGEGLPGHHPGPDAGGRLQTLRPVRPGRRDAAGGARHAAF